MENKLVRSILAGVVATAVMTGVTFMAPMMGLPKMNPAEMLSGMLGVSPVLGWLMHFMIGTIFAVVYVYLFNPRVHIHSRAGKGLLYGFIVFVFAQIMMFLMRKLMPMPSDSMENNMGLDDDWFAYWAPGIRIVGGFISANRRRGKAKIMTIHFLSCITF